MFRGEMYCHRNPMPLKNRRFGFSFRLGVLYVLRVEQKLSAICFGLIRFIGHFGDLLARSRFWRLGRHFCMH